MVPNATVKYTAGKGAPGSHAMDLYTDTYVQQTQSSPLPNKEAHGMQLTKNINYRNNITLVLIY